MRLVNAPSSEHSVLLLGGGPGVSGEYMMPLASNLPSGLSIASYDPRGTGQSRPGLRSPNQLTLQQQAIDIDRIRQAMGAADLHLIAHSWGAVVAAAYWHAHPTRVRSVLLIGPSPFESSAIDEAMHTIADRNKRREPRPPDPPEWLAADCRVWWDSFYYSYVDSSRIHSGELPADCNVEQHNAVLNVNYPFTVRPPDGGAETPVFVLYGDQDPLLHWAPTVLEALKRHDPVLALVPNCGHRPMFDCPDEFGGVFRAATAHNGLPQLPP